MDRVAAAARNNAAWCDSVCRAAGIATRWTDAAWIAGAPAPPLYPNVVTLTVEDLAPQLAAAADVPVGSSVKDSFAGLDLTPLGFEVLFEATWLWSGGPAASAGEPEVARLRIDDVAADVTVAAGAVGLTNVAQGNGFLALCNSCRDRWPGMPLVLYGRGGAVDWLTRHGFEPIGVLRIWNRAFTEIRQPHAAAG